MSDAPSKSRRSFLFGSLFGAGAKDQDSEGPHTTGSNPGVEPSAPAPDPHARPPSEAAIPSLEEGPLPMPWEHKGPARRRPQPGDGPRRPAIASTFQIAPDKCLAHRGQMCSVCRERCPIPGAITLTDHKPSIASDLCDGCGLCVQSCPAPILAIRFVAPPRPPGSTP
jgi:ferredoxin